MVYKRVRGWTSGRSLPVLNSAKYPPGIYHAIFRVGGGERDYLKYSPVAAKIILLSWGNVWKDFLRKAI